MSTWDGKLKDYENDYEHALVVIDRLRGVIKRAADKIDSPTRCPRVEIVRELRAALEE